VAIQGDRSKPAIFTYHEAGVNYVTCFGIFLKSLEVSDLLQYFCVYHVTAPGQQRGAPLWSGSYPNITNLAEQVFEVVRHYKLSYLVGLGVGLGANVLARFAMLYPDIVRGLVLIRLSPSEAKVSIRDWITTKMSEWVLKHGFSGEKLADIIADKFGRSSEIAGIFHRYHDRMHLQTLPNVCLILTEYNNRSSISEELVELLKCNCLFITEEGTSQARNIEEIVSKMDHSKVNILSLKTTGDHPMLEEHLAKIATALRLFMQGLGFASSLGLLQPESSVGKELLKQTSLTETGKDLISSSEH
jgi:hypothetical protein